MFSIELGDKIFREEGGPYSKGTIIIGGFREAFHAYLSFWGKKDYECHWHAAIERILRGEKRSALVTSMHAPETGDHIVWWPMWRVGNTVYIRNQLLFLDKLKSPLNPRDPFVHVSPRRTRAVQRPSEWTISISELRKFVEKNLDA